MSGFTLGIMLALGYAVIGVIVGSSVYYRTDPRDRWQEEELAWACGFLWPLLAGMFVVAIPGYGLFLLVGAAMRRLGWEKS